LASGRYANRYDPCQLVWQVDQTEGFSPQPAISFTYQTSWQGSRSMSSAGLAFNLIHRPGKQGGVFPT
jgi:hypothetical protein